MVESRTERVEIRHGRKGRDNLRILEASWYDERVCGNGSAGVQHGFLDSIDELDASLAGVAICATGADR